MIQTMLKKYRMPAIFSAALIVLLVVACLSLLNVHPKKEYAHLENGWCVTIDEDYFTGKNIEQLYQLHSGKLYRGDVITVSTILPNIGYLEFPAILYKSKYTTLNCYLDNELIYSFGNENYENGDFIGRLYHIIPLPREYAGKTLTFHMTVTENDPVTDLEAPVLGNQADIEGQLIHTNMFVISTGIFMFVFGVIFLFVSLIFAYVIPSITAQIVESLLCMNLGAWLLSYYNLFNLFYYTPLETQIEYFTLYLIVPYCYLILFCIQNVEKKTIFLTVAALSSAQVVIQLILQVTINIHLRETLAIYHANALIGFGFIIYFARKNIMNKNTPASTVVQMIGLTAFSIALLTHLFFYILDKAHIRTGSLLRNTTICTGCLLLATSMLANYFLYITKSYAERKESASLSHLAYADGLTDLPNRAMADKMLKELSNVETDYCIISIDLNGLKTVNDKFGHPSGDRYIKDFAKVLTSTFGEEDFIGRIGGDEFVVIIKDSSSKDIISMIERMNSALNVMNAIYPEYHRSAAAGFAFLHEVPVNDSHEVYLLADQRMYEQKRQMHEKLGINVRL